MENKKIQNALNEIRIICAIDHPNVVGYHEAFLDEKNKDLYVIMEYVGGGDLNDRIRFLSRSSKFLPEKTIWRYAVQILQGLQALHDRKIIHRDIKPENIFVSEDLETLKIGDLNVSKILRNKSMTSTVVGTPYYLAPEIWKNAMYDYRCDVFSFGCVLYELTALKVPFRGSSIAELFKQIEYGKVPELPRQYSKDLFEYICSSLTKNFKKRPTVKKLLQAREVSKRKSQFRDLIFSENRASKTMLRQMNISNLSDLSRVLPSLKNSRNNSVKILGIGGRSFDKSYNSKRDFQNFSCVNNSKFVNSYSIYSTYQQRIIKSKRKVFDQKTVKTVPKNKSAKKKPTEIKTKPTNPKKSHGLQARKNYIKLVKQQRMKREQNDYKNPSNKKQKLGKISQKSIKKKGSLEKTIELEMECSNVFGSDEELIEIMDELQSSNKKRAANQIQKVPKIKRKETTKKILHTRQSSKESNWTLKTNKKVFEIETESSNNIEANRRTADKKSLISKRETNQIKQNCTKKKVREEPKIKKNNKFENKASIDFDLKKKPLKEQVCLSVRPIEHVATSVTFSPKISTYTSTQFENENIIKLNPSQNLKSSKKKINFIQSEKKINNFPQPDHEIQQTPNNISKKPIRNSKSSSKFRKLSSKNTKLQHKKSEKKILSKDVKEYGPIEEVSEQEIISERKQKKVINTKKSGILKHKKTQSSAEGNVKKFLKPNIQLSEPMASIHSSKLRSENEKGSLYCSGMQTYSSKYNSNRSKNSKFSNISQKINDDKKPYFDKKENKSTNRTVISSYFNKAKKKQESTKNSTKKIKTFFKKEKVKSKKQITLKSSRIIKESNTSKREKKTPFKNLSKSSIIKKPAKKLLSTSALHKVKTSKKSTTKKYTLSYKNASTNPQKKVFNKSNFRQGSLNTIVARKPVKRVINKTSTMKNIYQNSAKKKGIEPRNMTGRIQNISLKKKILKKGQNKYMDLLEIKKMKKDLAKIKVAPFNIYQPISYK